MFFVSPNLRVFLVLGSDGAHPLIPAVLFIFETGSCYVALDWPQSDSGPPASGFKRLRLQACSAWPYPWVIGSVGTPDRAHLPSLSNESSDCGLEAPEGPAAAVQCPVTPQSLLLRGTSVSHHQCPT